MTTAASDPADAVPQPTVRGLLEAAVAGIGGAERPGQVQMAEAVAAAMTDGSTCWCRPAPAPASRWPTSCPALLHGGPVVVATATIALQNQVVDRDLPALVDAVEPLLGRRPTYAILKGRSQLPVPQQGARRDAGRRRRGAVRPVADRRPLGRDVVRLRGWADETETGDRDELDPGVTDRAWRQVSVTARECLGAAKCPYGAECFAELARGRAPEVDIVVTNHALLAIDALESFTVLPEHDVGRRRRGARAGRPGDRGGHRRADRAAGRAGGRAGPGGWSTAPRT